MLTETDNNKLNYLLKTNPDFDLILHRVMEDNKKTLSMFVHELRNPLCLLKGTIQYIESKHPETKDYKYWDQLLELINDMDRMMKDASVLNTYNTVDKTSNNLISLFHSVKNSFMPRAMEQQIDFQVTMNPGSEHYYSNYVCDLAKLKQVFCNIIKNAFEATCSGDFIHVTLDYQPKTDQYPSYLSIDVSNNGLPISEGEIDHIFEPFVTYKKNGNGLGLAIVKKIIDLHFGEIQVTSDENLTSFLILLPL